MSFHYIFLSGECRFRRSNRKKGRFISSLVRELGSVQALRKLSIDGGIAHGRYCRMLSRRRRTNSSFWLSDSIYDSEAFLIGLQKIDFFMLVWAHDSQVVLRRPNHPTCFLATPKIQDRLSIDLTQGTHPLDYNQP